MQFINQLFYIEHKNGKRSIDQSTIIACIMLIASVGGAIHLRLY